MLKKKLEKISMISTHLLVQEEEAEKDIYENLTFVHCLYGRLCQICKNFKLTEMDQRVYPRH